MTTANIYLSSGPTPPDQVSSPHSRLCSEEIDRTAKTTVTISGLPSDSPYLTVTVVQGQFENTVSKVEEEEVQMPSQINIELECAVPGCNFGGQGTKYKTPPLLHHQALQLLDWHRADAHGLGEAEVASDHDVQVDIVPETVCKPVLLRGCSVGQFKSFQVAWALYAEKYSQEHKSQLKEQYCEVDETRLNYLLNYELLSCIPPPWRRLSTGPGLTLLTWSPRPTC